MSQPLVSVVMPVYNHDKYVVAAIESVVHQTYKNIELVIIDDGSKDSSRDLISQFIEENRSANIKYHPQKNQGAHVAINNGIAASTGEFIAILNSDDTFDLTRIQKLVEHCHDRQTEWAFTYVRGVDSHGEPLSIFHDWNIWYNNNLNEERNSALTLGAQFLRANFAVSTGNLFFTRDIYNKVGPFKNYRLAHDLDFIMRCLLESEPSLLPEYLYNYRIHDTNEIHATKHLVQPELRKIFQDYYDACRSRKVNNPLAPSPQTFHYFFDFRPQDLFYFVSLKATEDRPQQRNSKMKAFIKAFFSMTLRNLFSWNSQITILCHELTTTGIPKLTLDVAEMLVKEGHRVSVVSMRGGPMLSTFREKGIPVIAFPNIFALVPGESFWKKAVKFSILKILMFFLVSRKVLVNSAACWPMIATISGLKWRRLVWYIHEAVLPFPYIAIRKAYDRISRSYSSGHIQCIYGAVGTRSMWQSQGFDGDVLYWSGKEKTTEKPRSKILKNIISVGTIGERKGTIYLVRAFINLKLKKLIGPEVVLSIVGGNISTHAGTLIKELFSEICAAGVRNEVQLLFNLSPEDIDKALETSDLYIQSSVMEGIPLSILNAMSIGMPIISTNISGCDEAIINNETGLLCPSRSVEALEKQILYAMNNYDQMLNLGHNAYERFNSVFSMEVTVPALQSKISDLLIK
jgi:glycosyltransferase involved in cell wall biosynthesis